MKKKSFFSADVTVLTVTILLLSALCYGIYHAASTGYAYAQEAYQKSLPRFADPERYIIIEEVDSTSMPLRSFVLDIESQKAFDIEDEKDIRNIVLTLGTDSADYERIYAGKITEKDIKGYKFDLKWALHEDEMEFCHTTYDEDGNIINHYHLKNEQVIEPTEKCEDCIGLIKYGTKEPNA